MDAENAELGAAVQVMNVEELELTSEEKHRLGLDIKRLSQVKKVWIANGVLIVDVDMGPLTGDALVKSIEFLQGRVIQLVTRVREAPPLELVR